MKPWLIAGALCFLVPTSAAFGQDSPETSQDDLGPEELAQLSLEELMNILVTTVAGVEEELFRTPAALHVITAEDIRRAGHRRVSEALRLAPGVFVGVINSQSYAVGTRGFNGGLANKTLVLIDGRAVYDPLFGGTFWNVQDVLLEDIDRIEVIRGPGATLWGENAVNGVINIITKSAEETQGAYLAQGGGTFEHAFTEARYGGQIDENTWYRLYGKWFERNHLVDSDGDSTHDDWDMSQGGFRLDHEGAGAHFTLQSDIYHSDRIGEFIRQIPVSGQHFQFAQDIGDGRNSGGNILFRLSESETSDSTWSLQGYYDNTVRVTNGGFQVERDTFDLQWRHGFDCGEIHDLLWGLGVRHTRDRSDPGANTALSPSSRSLDTFSAFIQDTITLEPDRWFAMIGSKFSHNDYTGFEVQPSARIWWTPNDRQTAWAAISRPVRLPTRIEREGILTFGFVDTGLAAGGEPSGIIVPLQVLGSDDVASEELTAYEAGYRHRVGENLTFDVSVFCNDYEELIYVPPTVFGFFNNDGFAETYGGELAINWQPADNWRLFGGYSFTSVQVHGPVLQNDELTVPQQMAQIRSALDVTDDLEFNSALYFVDHIPGLGIDDYFRLDIGLTWHVNQNFDISIWGQNLLDPQHPEFSANEVERSVYVMGTLRF
jgi:iron complex outermembrane receptor protein